MILKIAFAVICFVSTIGMLIYGLGTANAEEKLEKREAQPEQRWIPCDQKLPNDDKPVLLTEELRFLDGRRRRDVCMASYDPENMTWYEILGANTLEIPYPIAWMELPEPQQDE